MRASYIPIESLEEANAERLNTIYETYSAILNNLDQDNFSSTCRIPVSKIRGALSTDGGTLTGSLKLGVGADIDGIIPHEIKTELEAYANTAQVFTKENHAVTVQVTSTGINYLKNSDDVGTSLSFDAPEGYDATNSFLCLNMIGGGQGMPYSSDFFMWDLPQKNKASIVLTGSAAYSANSGVVLYYDVEILWFRYGL